MNTRDCLEIYINSNKFVDPECFLYLQKKEKPTWINNKLLESECQKEKFKNNHPYKTQLISISHIMSYDIKWEKCLKLQY